LSRPSRSGCDLCTELHGTAGPGRRELNDSEAVIESKVSIQPPTKTLVELFRAVGISDWDYDRFKFKIRARLGRRIDTAVFCHIGHILSLLAAATSSLGIR
jgi:hypothetical protein